MDNLNGSEDNRDADDESHVEQDNGIRDTESTEKRNVSALRNVPGLIPPSRRSNKHAKKLLIILNAMETSRNHGHKKT